MLFCFRLWAFATSPFCEYSVFIAILLNTTSLAMKFYKQGANYLFYNRLVIILMICNR
jgi:hypothetical protein